MENTRKQIIENIFHWWDEYAKTKQVSELIGLYAENAIFESPLVPVILDRRSGVLKGKKEILLFLEEGTKRRPEELVRWYRDGKYYTDGRVLIWEYPRQTPEGEQIDILELMEIDDEGLISCHRIYWGWFGTSMLIDRKADSR